MLLTNSRRNSWHNFSEQNFRKFPDLKPDSRERERFQQPEQIEHITPQHKLWSERSHGFLTIFSIQYHTVSENPIP